MASWNDITFDIFEMIVMQLDLFSRQHCAMLNHEWQQAIDVLKTVNRKMLSTPDHIPPSIFGATQVNSQNIDFRFHDIHSAQSYLGRIPGLKGQNRWLGAGEGWLLTSRFEGSNCDSYVLVNPLTNERILLPRTYNIPGEIPQRSYFKKIVVCRSPDHDEGLFLVGLPFLLEQQVAYLRTNDAAWNLLEEFRDSTQKCEDALLHEGKLYILTSKEKLYSFPLLEDLTFGEPSLLASSDEPQSNLHWKQKYLVECDGHLLAITRLNRIRGNSNQPDSIYIHKMCIDGPFTWNWVSSIERFAIFLCISSNSVVVPVDCLSCVKANHLYFAEPSSPNNCHGNPSNVGEYDIGSQSYRQLAYQPQLQFPVWLRPSLARVNGAEGQEN